jgi:hypothetical protein
VLTAYTLDTTGVRFAVAARVEQFFKQLVILRKIGFVLPVTTTGCTYPVLHNIKNRSVSPRSSAALVSLQLT